MNVPFKQDTRLGRFHSNLGADKLVLLRFTGADHVNDLFDYRTEVLATEAFLNLDSLIGSHAQVEFQTAGGGERFFDGIVTRTEWLGVGDGGLNRYALDLRPWFWIAGFRRQQRIFHDKTVTQILDKVFAAYSGYAPRPFDDRTDGVYPVIEYTVQFGESDLVFARRLMERYGINFYFEHEKGNHLMVLTSSEARHARIPGGTREYIGSERQSAGKKETFWEWGHIRSFGTRAVRLTDYNFKTPLAMMEADWTGDDTFAEEAIESYDYPGHYLEQTEGKEVAGLRVKQEQAAGDMHTATGDVISLNSGMVLTLQGQQVPGVKETDYLCLSARHSYLSDSYRSGGGGDDDGYSFTGTYSFIPIRVPVVPPMATPWPRIHGPQTAVVVGDGEIDCDEYGRILVRFHWDIEGAHSMRCRVAQSWAGKGWGQVVIPRVGMEVVVDHLEGDPDKPIVTGAVYNAENMPPYDLPGNKTRSTFKSDTHQGEGFNELRFEDKKGEEEIFVHAQKDRNVKVREFDTERVNINKMEIVDNHRGSETTNDQTEVIGGDLQVSVGPGSRGRMNGSDGEMPEDMGGNAKMLGKKAGKSSGGGNYKLNVEKNRTAAIGKDETITVGSNRTTTVTGNELKTTKGEYVLDVTDRITLKCGKSVITLDPSGQITIRGTEFKVNTSALVDVKSKIIKLN